MPFANRTIELSEDIKKQIIDASFASLPDFSRVRAIKPQSGYRSTYAELASDFGKGKIREPYVIQIHHPCYFFIQTLVNAADADFIMAFSPNRDYAACVGYVKDSTWNQFGDNLTKAHPGAKLGENLFITGKQSGSWDNISLVPIPMSNVGWYYRPALGGLASNNEDMYDFKYIIVPMKGTPSGTLLASCTLFAVSEKVGAINKTFTWGSAHPDNRTGVSFLYNGTSYGYNFSPDVLPANLYCP